MKISVDENRNIVLQEVYLGVKLVSADKEEFGICMRDSGFEFNYMGTWYEAKGGVVKPMGTETTDDILDTQCDPCLKHW